MHTDNSKTIAPASVVSGQSFFLTFYIILLSNLLEPKSVLKILSPLIFHSTVSSAISQHYG